MALEGSNLEMEPITVAKSFVSFGLVGMGLREGDGGFGVRLGPRFQHAYSHLLAGGGVFHGVEDGARFVDTELGKLLASVSKIIRVDVFFSQIFCEVNGEVGGVPHEIVKVLGHHFCLQSGSVEGL